jgi:prevent-host-death family protein
MATIPQRELRNNSAAILRAAEAGEIFTVTVGGRPVATLGPYRRRQWVPGREVADLLATPTDETWLDDVRAADTSAPSDPWDRR